VNRISFTVPAQHDLGQILDYIAKDNLDAAVKHRQRLEKRWLTLLDQPRIGTKRDDIEPNLRSVTEGNYVIFYRIVPDGIQVVRVLRASQDTKRAFHDP
jgi:toxin ParE1/3/4